MKLSFDERKWLLKCYWKVENVVEVQRPPPTRATIRIRNKTKVDGTVQGVFKGRCGRKRSSINNEIVDAVMQVFARFPKKSLKQCSREIGFEKSSVHRTLRAQNNGSLTFPGLLAFDVVVGSVLWQKVDIFNMYGLKEV